MNQFPISLEGLISAYTEVNRQTLGWTVEAGKVMELVCRRTDDLTEGIYANVIIDGQQVLGLRGTLMNPGESEGRLDFDTHPSLLSNTYTAGQQIELDISGTLVSGMNLNGYVRLEPQPATAPTLGDLTTLDSVKTFLGITAEDFDTYLATLISRVSDRMQRWMERDIHGQTVTAEKLDSVGEYEIQTKLYPVQSVSRLTVYATDLDASDYEVNASTGIIRRLEGGTVVRWPWGLSVMEIDYISGFDSVPMDLQQACDQEVAVAFQESNQGVGRLKLQGTVLPEGGTAAYVPGSWLPATLSTMQRYRRLA